MIRVIADSSRSERQFALAAQELKPQAMEARVSRGLVMLQSFVSKNIEVDTGRTKNSVFARVSGGRGNSVVGMLGTNVKYAPYVQDGTHSKQFFDYAAEREGQRVADALGEDFIVSVERVFD